MKHSVAIEGLSFDALSTVMEQATARAVTGGMDAGLTGFKGDLRDQVTGAGMGVRLANTWRGTRYPQTRDSINAAIFVSSKAPDIIDAFARGVTIRPVNGPKYLWLPTENVPARVRSKGGRGKHMTPEQAEAYFNAPQENARDRNGRLFAFVEAVTAQNGRGFRRATKGRLKDGRKAQAIILFWLRPIVHMPKRFTPEEAFTHWAGVIPDLILQR